MHETAQKSIWAPLLVIVGAIFLHPLDDYIYRYPSPDFDKNVAHGYCHEINKKSLRLKSIEKKFEKFRDIYI